LSCFILRLLFKITVMNYKNIHIGQMVKKRVAENGIEMSRICNFFRCTEKEIKEMYLQKDLNTRFLLRWSKLLEYDFFRLYSQHLILYAPPAAENADKTPVKSALPQFRKNIYTKEVINFIIEQIEMGKMTNKQIMERYRIPRTTLSKWITKYKAEPENPIH